MQQIQMQFNCNSPTVVILLGNRETEILRNDHLLSHLPAAIHTGKRGKATSKEEDGLIFSEGWILAAI